MELYGTTDTNAVTSFPCEHCSAICREFEYQEWTERSGSESSFKLEVEMLLCCVRY